MMLIFNEYRMYFGLVNVGGILLGEFSLYFVKVNVSFSFFFLQFRIRYG
jgi:hypothetical protein